MFLGRLCVEEKANTALETGSPLAPFCHAGITQYSTGLLGDRESSPEKNPLDLK